MTKRVAVGSHYRKGLLLPTKWVNGVGSEPKLFGPGALIPEAVVIPRRYFRDNRVVWVEDAPVKKAPSAPKLKAEPKETATPSPSSGVVGSSDPAPLEVTVGAAEDKPVEKKKRKRKKLFSSD